MMKYLILLSLFITAGNISSIIALDCFQCIWSSKGGDENCTSYPSKEFLKPCSTPHDLPIPQSGYVCVKSFGKSGDLDILSRYCDTYDGTKMVCTKEFDSTGQYTSCFCNEDGCNGSTVLKTAFLMPYAIPVLLKVLDIF